ncbi:hypothetical protein ACIGMX_34535 [Streptomyces aquilus]|uniref:hypothetical protein n=1 Tax=Streptomyces aquilus TaxID=2548456 RepID=UPI0037CD0890
MTAPCPGPCNNAWRNAEAGGDHDLTPTWGQPIHCTRCTLRAQAQLAEFPELVAAISLEALNGTAPKTTGTIGRAAAPSWPGQAARILTDHIVDGLLGLEDAIRAGRHLPSRTVRGREGSDLTAAVTFLRAHLPWALERFPGETDPATGATMDPADLIRRWHSAGQRFTRQHPRLEHHRVPCPRCELLTLYRADGEDYIECRNPNCQTLITPGEYADHTKELAAATHT